MLGFNQSWERSGNLTSDSWSKESAIPQTEIDEGQSTIKTLTLPIRQSREFWRFRVGSK